MQRHADHQHGDNRLPQCVRQRRADHDQYAAEQHQYEIGDEPRSAWPYEIGHRHGGERAECGEQRELRIRKPVQAESEQRRHDEGDAQCPVQHSAIGVVRKVAQESYHRASFVRTQFQHTTFPIAMRSG